MRKKTLNKGLRQVHDDASNNDLAVGAISDNDLAVGGFHGIWHEMFDRNLFKRMIGDQSILPVVSRALCLEEVKVAHIYLKCQFEPQLRRTVFRAMGALQLTPLDDDWVCPNQGKEGCRFKSKHSAHWRLSERYKVQAVKQSDKVLFACFNDSCKTAAKAALNRHFKSDQDDDEDASEESDIVLEIHCSTSGKSYSTPREAAEGEGCTVQEINRVLCGERKTAQLKAFEWRPIQSGLEKEEQEVEQESPAPEHYKFTDTQKKRMEVHCITSGKIYANPKEAAEGEACTVHAINRVLRGERKTAQLKAFEWRPIQSGREREEQEEEQETPAPEHHKLTSAQKRHMKIYCITSGKIYGTTKEASEGEGCTVNAISKVLRKVKKSTHGKVFEWRPIE